MSGKRKQATWILELKFTSGYLLCGGHEDTSSPTHDDYLRDLTCGLSRSIHRDCGTDSEGKIMTVISLINSRAGVMVISVQ